MFEYIRLLDEAESFMEDDVPDTSLSRPRLGKHYKENGKKCFCTAIIIIGIAIGIITWQTWSQQKGKTREILKGYEV